MERQSFVGCVAIASAYWLVQAPVCFDVFSGTNQMASDHNIPYAGEAFFGLFALHAIFVAVRYRRIVRLARTAGYDLCPNCMYRLTGLPTKHTCPECGTLYDKIESSQRWRGWVDRANRSAPGE
ncbi:MAG TPA: hypothetical protein P5081_08700 [Phycisphaerae bacterium]|nr:hypothetical protein [Phycisphaerae bacterium]HRW52953.1 hypothetical protein [Phycisphaerae bacterium]